VVGASKVEGGMLIVLSPARFPANVPERHR
jgi:hypothetical protein